MSVRIVTPVLLACCSPAPGLPARNSGGRPECRYCGGVYECHPGCPTRR